MTSVSQEVNKLIGGQLIEWDLARNNYGGLARVKTRNVELPGGAVISVQFNPGRIRSSAAKVDKQSIEARPCFLCEKNRPAEQAGILYGGKYVILLNPFPIFPAHLTIPSIGHTDQLIENHFEAMLSLALDLNGYTFFYNGPKCGASAPDHFHFQAGNKGFLPIESDFRSNDFVRFVTTKRNVEIYKWQNYHRNIISLKGKNAANLSMVLMQIMEALHRLQPNETEPMINMLSYYEENHLVVHLIPRILHRPDCFFAEGAEQILISPASVDLGGVFITPREEDFNKITANDVVNILNQVCLDEVKMNEIIQEVV